MNHSDDFEPNLFLGPLRTILLLLLVQAVGGFFVLEQPSSSLLTRHDRFRWLVRHESVLPDKHVVAQDFFI